MKSVGILHNVVRHSGVVERYNRGTRFVAASRYDVGGRSLIVSLNDHTNATIRPSDFLWTADIVAKNGFYRAEEAELTWLAAFRGDRAAFENDIVMLKLAGIE